MSEHAGHRNRLRSRYQREGLGGFAPHEVLELLLTYAIPRVDTNPLAHDLIKRFGSLHGVLEAAPVDLCQVPGIGETAATLISMLLPVFRMYEQEKLLPRRRLSTYAELAAYCRTLFLGENCEKFYLLCLDAKLNLIAVSLIASGTPSQVQVMPRLILQTLLRHNAVAAVLTHNHPSGSPEPSNADAEMTLEIQSILNGVGIRLVDHVIISGVRSHSVLSNVADLGGGQRDALLAAENPRSK